VNLPVTICTRCLCGPASTGPAICSSQPSSASCRLLSPLVMPQSSLVPCYSHRLLLPWCSRTHLLDSLAPRSPLTLAVEQLDDSPSARHARSLHTQFHLGVAYYSCDIFPRSCSRSRSIPPPPICKKSKILDLSSLNFMLLHFTSRQSRASKECYTICFCIANLWLVVLVVVKRKGICYGDMQRKTKQDLVIATGQL
jgi:hypothetical protein